MTQSAQKIVESDELSGVNFVLLEPGTGPVDEKPPPVFRLSSSPKRDRPANQPQHSVAATYRVEELLDLMRLIAAIVLISLIHHYIPNDGKAPHSVGDVVKSTEIFPG